MSKTDRRLTYVLISMLLLCALIFGAIIGSNWTRTRFPVKVVQVPKVQLLYDTVWSVDTVFMVEKQYIVERDTMRDVYVVLDTLLDTDTVFVERGDKIYYAERVYEDSTLTAVAGAYAYGPVSEVRLSIMQKQRDVQTIQMHDRQFKPWMGAGLSTRKRPIIVAGIDWRKVGAGVYVSTGEAAFFVKARINGKE